MIDMVAFIQGGSATNHDRLVLQHNTKERSYGPRVCHIKRVSQLIPPPRPTETGTPHREVIIIFYKNYIMTPSSWGDVWSECWGIVSKVFMHRTIEFSIYVVSNAICRLTSEVPVFCIFVFFLARGRIDSSKERKSYLIEQNIELDFVSISIRNTITPT